MAEQTKPPQTEQPTMLDNVAQQIRERTAYRTQPGSINPGNAEDLVAATKEIHANFMEIHRDVEKLSEFYKSLNKGGIEAIRNSSELKEQFKDIASFVDLSSTDLDKQVKAMNQYATKLTKIGDQVQALRSYYKLTTKDAIDMARTLKASDKTSAITESGKARFEKRKQEELKMYDLLEQQVMLRIVASAKRRGEIDTNEYAKTLSTQLKEREKFNKALEKFDEKHKLTTIGSFFKQSATSKGTILGSLMGNPDKNDIGSIMMSLYGQRLQYRKALQKDFPKLDTSLGLTPTSTSSSKTKEILKLQAEATAKGIDNSNMADAIAETASNTQTLEQKAINPELQGDYDSAYNARMRKYGIAGDLGAFLLAGGVGSLATAGAAAKSGADYLQTATTGPVGVIKGITDGITKGIGKLSPKGAAMSQSLFGLMLTAMTRNLEEKVATSYLTRGAYAQSGGNRYLTSRISKNMYDLGLAKTGEYATAIEGMGGKNYTAQGLAAFEGLARMGSLLRDDAAAQEIINNIATSTADLSKSVNIAERSFHAIASATKNSNLNAKQLAQWTAQASAQARLLNVDYKAVETITGNLIKNNKRLQGFGVDVRTMGGDILSDLSGSDSKRSMALKAYTGMTMGYKDPLQGILASDFGASMAGQMGYDSSSGLLIGPEGIQNDQDFLVTRIMQDQKNITDAVRQAVAGETDPQKAAAKAWVAAQEVNKGMGYNFNDSTLRTMMTTPLTRENILKDQNKYKDTTTLIGETLSAAQRQEKIMSTISIAVMGIVDILMSFPDVLHDKLFGNAKEKERAEKYLGERWSRWGKVLKTLDEQGSFAATSNPYHSDSLAADISESKRRTTPVPSSSKSGYVKFKDGNDDIEYIPGENGDYKFQRNGRYVFRLLEKKEWWNHIPKRHSGGFLPAGNLGVLQFGETLQNLRTNEFAMVANSPLNVLPQSQAISNSTTSNIHNHYHFNGAVLDGDRLLQYIEDSQSRRVL